MSTPLPPDPPPPEPDRTEPDESEDPVASDASLAPEDDETIAEDLPCLRCEYNLRGLRPSGRCPECGAAILRTLRFATQEVICPTCLRPCPAHLPRCPHCTGYLNAAAAVADYFRPAPMTPSSSKPHPDDEPTDSLERPRGNLIAVWLFFLPLGLFSVWRLIDGRAWPGMARIDPCSAGLFLLLAAVSVAVLFRATRRYRRLRREVPQSPTPPTPPDPAVEPASPEPRK